MKKITMFLCFITALTCATFISCDSDDDNMPVLPQSVQDAFNKKFPNTHYSRWKIKQHYYVFDIKIDGMEAEGWFDDTKWVMTETDITYNSLPDSIKKSLSASIYSDWKIDDIDKIERNEMHTVYVVEIEKDKKEKDLYYLEDGTLIKEADDNGSNSSYLPEMPQEIANKMKEMYPDSKILDIEFENAVYEVEIYDGKVEKEVVFGRDFSWMYTSWDVIPSDLPEAVIKTIVEKYPDYVIDEAEFFEMAGKTSYYEIELKRGDEEINVNVTINGDILF